MIKLCNPMINCVTWCAMLYFFTHRVPQFIIGLHNFSSGYAILALGYKFRGWQFETPGYTHTVGGRRGLSYVCIEIFILLIITCETISIINTKLKNTHILFFLERYIRRTNNNDNILNGAVVFILFYINIIRYGFNFMFTFGGCI